MDLNLFGLRCIIMIYVNKNLSICNPSERRHGLIFICRLHVLFHIRPVARNDIQVYIVAL